MNLSEYPWLGIAAAVALVVQAIALAYVAVVIVRRLPKTDKDMIYTQQQNFLAVFERGYGWGRLHAANPLAELTNPTGVRREASVPIEEVPNPDEPVVIAKH